jgi:hypothetical protein
MRNFLSGIFVTFIAFAGFTLAADGPKPPPKDAEGYVALGVASSPTEGVTHAWYLDVAKHKVVLCSLPNISGPTCRVGNMP